MRWCSLLFVSLLCSYPSIINAQEKLNATLIKPIITKSQNGKIETHIQEILNKNLKDTAAGSSTVAVTVTIQLSRVPADLKQQLEALNINVLNISQRYRLATAQLTRDSDLTGLEKLSAVLYVSQASEAQPNSGKAVDHSVSALNVDQVRKYLPNLTGKGVRIGIISTSFSHSSDVRGDNTTPARCKAGTLKNAKDQLTGDLPASVEIRNDACTGNDNDEGAAMAENVHDIAPDADISFYSGWGSQLNFVNAVKDLCKPRAQGGAGADIIVDDLFYFQEPFYQPGIINQAIQDCVNSGVMFFTIAGNDSDRSYEFSYKDIDPSTADTHSSSGDKIAYGNDFQKWPNGSAYLPVTIPAGKNFRAVLNWNQPYISYQADKKNFPLIDFDLYLLEKNAKTNQMQLLERSTDTQGSSSYNNPFEQVWYTNQTNQTQTLYLAVNHWSGNTDVIPQNQNVPVKLALRFPDSSDSVTYGITFNGSMMYGHAYAKGAITVASMPWYASEPYVNSPSDIWVEPETSRGSASHAYYFDIDGNFASATRQGPTLTGTDGGDTTFFGQDIPAAWNAPGEPDGYPNFFGTSSAAPTVAAVAALLKQYAGSDTSSDLIRQALISSARDIKTDRGSVGWDPVTGAGEVDAQAALDYLKKKLGQ
jgi:hypothetical protein